MIDEMIDRENKIFNVLNSFRKEDLDFILVGGYAVSAFSHRFSVDADLVISDNNQEEFAKLLEGKGFEEGQRKDLKSIYGGEFISYKKGRKLPVTVDLLVNSLKCRQTGASWSYNYLRKNSKEKTVRGSENSVEVMVPEKELLIAIKLHSVRSTDIRDVVALIENSDFDKIKKHLNRGQRDKVKNSLNRVFKEINYDKFKDSFKGVFQETEISETDLKSLREFLKGELKGGESI